MKQLNSVIGDYSIMSIASFLSFVKPQRVTELAKNETRTNLIFGILLAFLATLSFLFWILVLLNRKNKTLLFIALSVTCMGGMPLMNFVSSYSSGVLLWGNILNFMSLVFLIGVLIFLPILMA